MVAAAAAALEDEAAEVEGRAVEEEPAAEEALELGALEDEEDLEAEEELDLL